MNITGVSRADGGPGEQIVVTGYQFTGVTDVVFGVQRNVATGARAAFTVTDDRHITVTVPPTRVQTTFLTVVKGGEAPSVSFHTLHPGRWIQPPDAWTNYIPFQSERSGASGWTTYSADTQFPVGDAVPPRPVEGVTPIGTSADGDIGFGLQGYTDGLANDPVIGWNLTRSFSVHGSQSGGTAAGSFRLDLTPGTTLPPTPANGRWQVESQHGVPLGPLTLQRELIAQIIAFEPVDHNAPGDMEGSSLHVELRRLPAGSFVIDPAGVTPRARLVDETVWPHLSAMPLVASIAMHDGTVTHTNFGDPTVIPHLARTQNIVDTEVSMTFGDLDPNGDIGFAVVLSCYTTGAPQPSKPVLFTNDPANGVHDYNTRLQLAADASHTWRYKYRPPRYRLLGPWPSPQAAPGPHRVVFK